MFAVLPGPQYMGSDHVGKSCHLLERERGERGGGVTVHWERWGFSPGVTAEKCVVCVLTATEVVSVLRAVVGGMVTTVCCH